MLLITGAEGAGGVVLEMSPAGMPLGMGIAFNRKHGNVAIKLPYDNTLICSLSLCEYLAASQLYLSAVSD